jgi:hypothetical protein
MDLFKLYDFNTRNEAIVRMRGSGSIVPKKVSGKYIYDVEKAKAIDSIERSYDILIIHDTGSSSSANTLLSQLKQFQDNQLKQFQDNETIIENTKKINMKLKVFGGNIIIKSIFETGDINSIFEIGEGNDLSVSKYGVIIICPNVSFNDDKNPIISNYNENFGPNLQKYINSGGNVIASSNLWVNSPPGFNFYNTPFIYKKDYNYNNYTQTDLSNITFSNQQPRILKPILNDCSPTGTGIGKQNVIKNIIPSSKAFIIASTTQSEGNIPYISALVNYNTGSRSIVINSNIFINSNKPNELTKIIYKGIYWCLKISL